MYDIAIIGGGPGGYAADYLLGRHFLFEREPELALQYLLRADRAELTEPALIAELYILTGRAYWSLGQCELAVPILQRIPKLEGVRLEQVGRGLDWLDRCRWENPATP